MAVVTKLTPASTIPVVDAPHVEREARTVGARPRRKLARRASPSAVILPFVPRKPKPAPCIHGQEWLQDLSHDAASGKLVAYAVIALYEDGNDVGGFAGVTDKATLKRIRDGFHFVGDHARDAAEAVE